MATDKQHTTLNVPTLRFPEFSGEWKQTIFENICHITTGNMNTQDKVEDGIYPFFVRSNTVERINNYTFDGTAILTAGDGVGVGKVFHFSEGKIGVHQRVYILSDFKCNARYLYYYFSSRFYDRVKRMSAKNSVDSVRYDMIAKMPLSLPNENEQNRIAKVLTLLDERIATQRKVIEKLQSLIGGIYKSIFADIDCSFRLDEICEIRKGQQVNGTELFEDGEYYVMNGGVEPSGCYDKFNTPANTISISEGGNSCGYVQFNNRPFWSGGHCYTLRNVNLQYNLRFLYHYLKANESEIMKLRIGSGLPNIQKKDLAAYCIPNLDIDKQITISKSLDAVQTEIELSKDLLVRYEKQKMFLLSAMFI
jgi:type I restriction enzyme S subunit